MKQAVIAGTIASFLLATATPAIAVPVQLRWTDNSNNETGFRVERSPTGPNGPWSLMATTAANVSTLNQDELADGRCYRVFAFNAAGDSAPSNVACFVIAPASGLTIVVMP